MTPIDIGSRLELFVDRYLIDALRGTTLRLHQPQKMPQAERFIKGGYMTVIKDGDLYRAYYRDRRPGYDGDKDDGNIGEIYRYAESRDGHEWTYPSLGLFEIAGSLENNVILAGETSCTHNFSPFLDTRPGVGGNERFKALAGTHKGGGLYPFVSGDGIRWTQTQEEPVITSGDFAFDSQNVSFWSETEGCYVCYFRTWDTPHGRLRTISRTTSPDFTRWDERIPMHPNDPGEHLYTSQTHPYFRAPHIYIATPTRFAPDRGESTEILFMASRSGAPYERLFKEAFIRPGLDPDRWGNRSNYAALNVVPTGPEEMSVYHAVSGHRFALRTDGFVSVNAPYEGGELITSPLVFQGQSLVLNLSTSATGSIQVEIQDAGGIPAPGFGIDDCSPIVGDRIEHVVTWKNGSDVGGLSGRPVRLRFVMQDSDLFSMKFR